ncbi:hypothetical protein HYH03_000075 [Edaphochlamys debaryana]|uniref:Uncharacterized protein n=1 Tax=Edaphochlamys debaryana TaxID=47281 RepID=A0A835YGX6_9CHLO|nr:hypothetical protein HYH03_000075 [Edaphochlamys debaryana]|eukprot:KAG2501569.1 hypothetical protein HYH03_000075 [Edaphochlamys debaryana]
MGSDKPQAVDWSSTTYGLKLKAPKVVVGPFELGLAGEARSAADGETAQALGAVFKPTITVKDIIIRGKLEVEPKERKLNYSKKLRLPFLNTELFRVRLSAQLPSAEAAGGVLGRGLGLTLSFDTDKAYQRSIVRKAPSYSVQLAPRLGLPRAAWEAVHFPGSVSLKASGTLSLSDAPTLAPVRGHLDVHSLTAVVRLYDASKVKPCRMARNLADVAHRLALEDVEGGEPRGAAGSKRSSREPAKVSRSAPAADEEPDFIDHAAAKTRQWVHAIAVNSCIATKHLQEEAATAGERLRELLGGRSGNNTPAAAAGAGRK